MKLFYIFYHDRRPCQADLTFFSHGQMFRGAGTADAVDRIRKGQTDGTGSVAVFRRQTGGGDAFRQTVALPDLHAVLDGMAAEEFGHGMSIAEMKQTAALYLFLRRDIKRRIAFPERMKLRYIKRKI